ncbi:MAG TPA: hypothetical protein VFT31_01010 [Kribbella sp.]|nr:hypothetical protein [Kribbella sp.]
MGDVQTLAGLSSGREAYQSRETFKRPPGKIVLVVRGRRPRAPVMIAL